MNSLSTWISRHDTNYTALRRAARTALVLPLLFAFSIQIIGNLDISTFAAFGSIALLMLVDFTGPMRGRLQGQAALAMAGAILICLGTLVSQTTWLSVLVMAVVALVVLFAGVVSSVLASATTSLLLVFILSTAVAGPVHSIPARLVGWAIASTVAFFAVWLLWPAKDHDALRSSAVDTCRAVARFLRVDVANRLDSEGRSRVESEHVADDAHHASVTLRERFLSAPWRPTGLSVSSRATVHLVDELLWIDTLLRPSQGSSAVDVASPKDCQIRSASASVLEAGADLLERPISSPAALSSAQGELRAAIGEMELDAIQRAPVVAPLDGDSAAPSERSNGAEVIGDRVQAFMDSLQPGFRALELGFGASLAGVNIDLAAGADRRGWLDAILGVQPGASSGRLVTARERVVAHIDWHSVWLHNSLRGAIGLAIAVLIAKQTGLQHSFWVILGALSVLRSSAASTGQNALRAVLGTAVGFFLGAGILALVGTNVTVLWFVLPLAVLVAGFAPTAISFAAGQAGFTLTLVILYNLLQPVGWRVGLYRVEDVAIGSAVSVGVGLLFWPRGAAKALGSTLRQAYEDVGGYLVAAVAYGSERCDRGAPTTPTPEKERMETDASGRRLDDAFRTYLGERGSKPLPLAEVTALVRSVATLRQIADAVVDLWSGEDHRADVERVAERVGLSRDAARVQQWYGQLGASLTGEGSAPAPVTSDPRANRHLLDALRNDLFQPDEHVAGIAVRLIWTKDYLDVARRLEATLVGPARVTALEVTEVASSS